MVKCDECSNCYHFNCCEPKLRGNPKKRGYMWYCNDCGESDGEEEDDEDIDDNEVTTEHIEIAANEQNKLSLANENGISIIID